MSNRERFKEWISNHNYTPTRLAEEAGIPVGVINHCLYDSAREDINPRRMSVEYRVGLHRVTGLDMFSMSPQNIAGPDVDLDALNPWQKELLGWMSEHNHTMSMLAKAIGLGRSSIRAYCKKPASLRKVSKKNQQLLYNYTKIPTLAHANDYSVEDNSDEASITMSNKSLSDSPMLAEILSEVKSLKQLMRESKSPSGPPRTTPELIERTHSAFVTLVEILEQYKTRPHAIAALRERIPARTAGYAVSLLNALYANDQMSKWLLEQPMPLEVRR